MGKAGICKRHYRLGWRKIKTGKRAEADKMEERKRWILV